MVAIPESVQRLWDAWNIRGVILVSLFLQTTLVLCAPVRKRSVHKFVVALLWSAYLLADWAASFAVGLISSSKGNSSSSSASPENEALLAFWAPFLLLHLGGPDTITAFSLEDNELWLRHLLGLVTQAVATGYVFIQTVPGENNVWIPTILMFVAGIIKYAERSRALFLASLDQFRDSMIKDPDAGPNYAKLMEEYASKKEAKLPTQIIMIPEPDKDAKAARIEVKKGELSDLEVVQYAYDYFNIFKGLIVDLIFSFKERDESRKFFDERTPEDAFQMIEVELNFIYGVLYTKVQIVHSRLWSSLRTISFGAVVSALVIFHYRVKKRVFEDIDVKVTYTLLGGAIALDFIALFMAVFSDRTAGSLKKRDGKSDKGKSFLATLLRLPATLLTRFLKLKKTKWSKCETTFSGSRQALATSIFFRRWCGSVSGHSLIRYCLKGRPRRIYKVKHFSDHVTDAIFQILHIDKALFTKAVSDFFHKVIKSLTYLPFIGGVVRFIKTIIHLVGRGIKAVLDFIIEFLGLTDLVDEILYKSSEPLTKELWDFIFHEVKNKSKFADDPETAKRISSAKGDWVLQYSSSNEEYQNLIRYVTDVAYDQSILLWHIATDLCYQSDLQNNFKGYEDTHYLHLEFSKILSDYLVYLLVMQPTMMSAVAGIGKIRFRDTCAEAERFFRRRNFGPNDETDACKSILEINTDVSPIAVKGDRSKSVLFDASILAKELQKLKQEKWKLMSRVWVEILSYAAGHCVAKTHAEQVSRGGELITFVWLLMAHFGIGEQFQINEGHARAKLMVGK
ncbi:uncharacterized protein LOC119993148 [Tripterygium wilfordii]|uniref:uncharacterized protein LOC119993148 n=1 Tax=Tripterygium wilfordii TaxID=458696 RepID=UPI0018F8619E|nr:uncharacterized protein LOC119993148 [Tripterygium wilfordii]XP_038696030.1 uncharacterized protein LOC119993148 [Tripterygium wilfordii]XP_038696031.1 uncharacterized protein LOC119993148 [Tripterygium wilfordii]